MTIELIKAELRSRSVTSEDLAKFTGVDPSTVRHILNQTARYAPDTENSVLDMAKSCVVGSVSDFIENKQAALHHAYALFLRESPLAPQATKQGER